MQSSLSAVKPDEQIPLQLRQKRFYNVLHYDGDQCEDPDSVTYKMDGTDICNESLSTQLCRNKNWDLEANYLQPRHRCLRKILYWSLVLYELSGLNALLLTLGNHHLNARITCTSCLWSRQSLKVNFFCKPLWNELCSMGVEVLVRVSDSDFCYTCNPWYVCHHETSLISNKVTKKINKQSTFSSETLAHHSCLWTMTAPYLQYQTKVSMFNAITIGGYRSTVSNVTKTHQTWQSLSLPFKAFLSLESCEIIYIAAAATEMGLFLHCQWNNKKLKIEKGRHMGPETEPI